MRGAQIFAGFIRSLAAAAIALALCAPAQAAMPMGFDEARHLLNRTSFAANVDDIEAFAKLTRAQAVDQLLAWTASTKVMTPPPAWINEYQSPRRLRTMSEDQRKLAQRELIEHGAELRAWWMTEMLTTASPLTEKMTLFWHNHFVVEPAESALAPCSCTGRTRCCASTRSAISAMLLHEVSRDPAMVIYLDNASNRKAQPNENFAREVMELFTLGEGNYSEADIKEAARAFTGWSIDPRYRANSSFGRKSHDDGAKTVLGRSGNFDGDDGARHPARAAARPRSSSSPNCGANSFRRRRTPREVKRIARMFRDSRYDIKVALRALLTSDAFYARAEPRGARQVAGGARRRHAAAVPLRAPATLHRSCFASRAARAEPLRAAQREGLARRRSLDQQRRRCSRASSSSTGCSARRSRGSRPCRWQPMAERADRRRESARAPDARDAGDPL